MCKCTDDGFDYSIRISLCFFWLLVAYNDSTFTDMQTEDLCIYLQRSIHCYFGCVFTALMAW